MKLQWKIFFTSFIPQSILALVSISYIVYNHSSFEQWEYMLGAILALWSASSFLSFKVSSSTHQTLEYNLDKLQEQFASLSGTSEEINTSNNLISNSTTEQSSAIQETVIAIDEINAMVKQNSDSAAQTKKTANMSRDFAHRGLESMGEVNKSIADINESSTKIIEQVQSGNKQMEEVLNLMNLITDKTQVINDIVFQTKLLSFNASVEAARAGEHGKGFAVVAAEVGNLAQLSGKSATEISEILEKSVKFVNRFVSDTQEKANLLMQEAESNLKRGKEASMSCESVLQEVVSQSQHVSSLVSEIAQASEEQSRGVEDITSAIRSLDSVTAKNSLVAKQANQVAQGLSSQSNSVTEDLRGLFKLVSGSEEHSISIKKFKWTDELLLGVKEMDDEHKILVAKINHVVEGLNNHLSVAQLLVAFDDLAAYVVKHFNDEENFMKSINFPDFQAHQTIHKTLVEKVVGHRKELEDGNLDEAKLISFLKNWLYSHIMGLDAQYGKYHEQENKNLKLAS